ncbi:MAG TPA: cyclic nucleotide-binding domain-containing protein, partial [Planctomycetota bacterium]|nr:cyclic nucleotide-binding domain-containing protein [Planctomycetota bacterium]
MSEPQGMEQLLRQQFGGRCRDVALAAGEVLFAQGDPADAVYLVTDGRLRVVQAGADGCETTLTRLRPGDIVGELGILTAGTRTASVLAEDPARLLRLERQDLDELLASAPAVAARLADLARERLHRSQLAAALRSLLGQLGPDVLEDIERQVAWVPLRGGELLVREGEADRSLYLLLSGRLRVTTGEAGGVLGEVAPGESVGEIALLTGEPRSGAVRAVRDSLLARLSPEAFEAASARHPEILAALARLTVRRLRARERPLPAVPRALALALVAASPEVPLAEAAQRLAGALARLGPTLHLSSAAMDRLTGLRGAAQLEPGAPRSGWLAAWLGEREARHTYLLFEADATPSAWTDRCIRQADRVVLVARATDDPRECRLESVIGNRQSEMPKPLTLVLLHPSEAPLPSGTRAWLEALPTADHYHVREGAEGDVARLARCVAGRAVGLALGGGGARGLAHLGVIRALIESGVPIDRVAGTSMGAIIGASTAMEMDYETELALGRRVFIEGKPHKEYTLPLFSLVRGRRLDRHLSQIYGDARIEDLWRPFLCVSCNLTTTEMVIHTRGLVWRAIRASLAIPGIFTPVVQNGELLVDGGVLNNLPGDLLRRAGCSRVVVVDVSPPLDLAIECAEFPSPWRCLWRRLWRRKHTPHVPSVVDILMRTVVISSEQK